MAIGVGPGKRCYHTEGVAGCAEERRAAELGVLVRNGRRDVWRGLLTKCNRRRSVGAAITVR